MTETVSFVRNRVLVASARGAAARARGRLPRGAAGSRAACGAWSGAAAEVAARPLRRPAARGLRGRARPAHAGVQRDAGAAARRSTCARKEFIATASHELRTPIFSLGGLRGAAAGRGARRGHPARVPRHDARAGGAAPEAVGGPARPLAPRRRLGRAGAGARGPVRARALGRRRVHARAGRARHRARASTCRTTGPEATLRPANGWRRSCVSCSTTPFATRRRARDVTVSAHRDNGAAEFTVADTGPGPARGAAPARSSSASTPATPRAAPGSASPSRASWPSAWTGGSRSPPAPGSTASRSSCPPGRDDA